MILLFYFNRTKKGMKLQSINPLSRKDIKANSRAWKKIYAAMSDEEKQSHIAYGRIEKNLLKS